MNTTIEKDIKSRFNKVENFEEIKVRSNAKIHVFYFNEILNFWYSVGVVTFKGEDTRILKVVENDKISIYKF